MAASAPSAPSSAPAQVPVQFGQSDDPTYQAAAAKAGQAPSSSNSYKPGVITTSSASRATYATNMAKLNTAKTNLGSGSAPQNYSYVDVNGKQQSVTANSPEEAINKAVNIAPRSGVITPTLKDNTNVTGGAGAAAPSNPGSTPNNGTGNTGTGNTGTGNDNAGTPNPNTTTYTDGTVDNNDGSITLPDGTVLAKGLKNVWDTTGAQLDDAIAQAKTNLQTAAANMQNDPTATAAIAQIQAQWDAQVTAQKAKNAIVLGSYTEDAARSGGLQYANVMDTAFMGSEQQDALDRITDLTTKETSAVMTAEASYKNGDVTAFNNASNALENAQTDKASALNKLLTTSNAMLKQKQSELAAAQSATKAGISNDVTVAKNIAAGVADAISKSGITDPDQIDAYLQKMAQQNGISNWQILAGAVTTAGQTADKTSASLANTKSEINKRNITGGGKAPAAKGGTDGSYSYSAYDISQYIKFMNQGGTTSDGNGYAARGGDGYVDPGAYVYAYQDWIKQGGTSQGFVKKFPITNVNPASYPQLPQALQPKTKTPAAAPA